MDSSSFDPSKFQDGRTVNIGRLQAGAPHPPRFLIRVHTARSQGSMTSNSFTSAAEDSALQHNLLPPNLRNYTPAVFEQYTHQHLTNFRGDEEEEFHSPFISLTVSLRTALAWAKMKSLWYMKEIRIAVLDTSTILASNCDCENASCHNPFHQNPIWPANMLYRSCDGSSRQFPDEFIAFGHVRGKSKICTFAELNTTFLSQYLPELDRIPRNQRYEELPVALASLWQTVQPVERQEKDMIIYMARQLSNDRLLIPMVAFVLCMRSRDPNDRQVLATIVKAATNAEKTATYDYLGFFKAVDIYDFYSKKEGQYIKTADSPELVQTSALLERVKFFFAEAQEREVHMMLGCTTVALICQNFCPRRIGASIEKASLTSRRHLTGAIDRSFSRLQSAVFKSRGGLRVLLDALKSANRTYDLGSGLVTPISPTGENEHDFWSRTFSEIATQVEALGTSGSVIHSTSTSNTQSAPQLSMDPLAALRQARSFAASRQS